jgi:hypothetical protein
MKIKLSPTRSDKTLILEKQGDTLIINGEPFDFTLLPEGGVLPQDAIFSEDIVSDVERINGEVNLTILFPHGTNATHEQRFPEPITVTEDGEVELP